MGKYLSAYSEWPSDSPPVVSLDVSADTTLTVDYAVTEHKTGRVSLYPEGIVVTEFAGLNVSDRTVAKYVRHAIDIWRSITHDDETVFEYDDAPLPPTDTPVSERLGVDS